MQTKCCAIFKSLYFANKLSHFTFAMFVFMPHRSYTDLFKQEIKLNSAFCGSKLRAFCYSTPEQSYLIQITVEQQPENI